MFIILKKDVFVVASAAVVDIVGVVAVRCHREFGQGHQARRNRGDFRCLQKKLMESDSLKVFGGSNLLGILLLLLLSILLVLLRSSSSRVRSGASSKVEQGMRGWGVGVG